MDCAEKSMSVHSTTEENIVAKRDISSAPSPYMTEFAYLNNSLKINTLFIAV